MTRIPYRDTWTPVAGQSERTYRLKADHPPMTKPGDFYGEQGCATCNRPLRIVSLWHLDLLALLAPLTKVIVNLEERTA